MRATYDGCGAHQISGCSGNPNSHFRNPASPIAQIPLSHLHGCRPKAHGIQVCLVNQLTVSHHLLSTHFRNMTSLRIQFHHERTLLQKTRFQLLPPNAKINLNPDNTHRTHFPLENSPSSLMHFEEHPYINSISRENTQEPYVRHL
jgi:hypothetical protein